MTEKIFLRGFWGLLSLTSLWLLSSGCGVKGRPLPPEYPPYIGRGMIEESTKENLNTTPSEPIKEIEDKKTESLDKEVTTSTPDSKEGGTKSKSKSSKKNKEKKK